MADGTKDPFDFPDDPLAGVDGLNAPPFDSDNPTPSFPPPNFPPSTSPPSPSGVGSPLDQPPPSGSASPNFPPPEAFPPPQDGEQPGAPAPPPETNPPPGSFAAPVAPNYGTGAGPVFPPPEDQKKKRGCLFWAVIAFVAFILLVGGCSIATYFLVRGLVDATNQFLGEVEAGNYDEAAALAPAGCSMEAGQIEADLGGLTSYQIISALPSVEDQPAQAVGSVTVSGETLPFTAAVQKNANDDWAVCSYSFDDVSVEIGN